jgi:hypothetical protein
MNLRSEVAGWSILISLKKTSFYMYGNGFLIVLNYFLLRVI